jgi:hypothetical protein
VPVSSGNTITYGSTGNGGEAGEQNF